MTLSTGEVFAGYTIVRPLGAGGMGEVYLAQHPRLPRREALKVLRPEISNDETFQQRFIREADSIAALEHPHIVTVHDRGETDGRLWIATQYVDGTDAAKLVQDRYPAGMPADEAASITTAIAEALDYAHNCGLLHRDVKPANILLTHPDRDGHRRVYLADFGIARPLEDPSGLTSTNFTVGTFAYSAPEQLVGKELNGRADQYALAATTYHLLTGTTVFPDSNPVAVIGRHLTETPPPPSSIRPELAPFDSAFARALAKDPDHRFASCRDFARAITAVVDGSDGGYSPSAPTQEAPVPKLESTATAQSPRPSLSLALTGAVAALLGLIAVGAFLWHPWVKQGQSTTSSSSSLSPSVPATTSATPTTSSTPTPAPPPPVQTETASTEAARTPTVTLYDECTDFGATGTGADGTPYYCAQIGGTEGYIWALAPGRGAPNPYPRPGSTCSDPGSTSRSAVYGPVTCKAGSGGGWTWQPGASSAAPVPAYSAQPDGPQPLQQCTVPGALASGPYGPMQCKAGNVPGIGPGWFWGMAS